MDKITLLCSVYGPEIAMCFVFVVLVILPPLDNDDKDTDDDTDIASTIINHDLP